MESYQLRDLEEKDLTMVLSWRNSEHIREHSFQQEVIRLKDHLQWYQRKTADPHSFLWIFEINKISMGLVSIDIYDPEKGIANWGFYIGDDHAPRGSGTKMGFLALDHVFSRLNVNFVLGEVIATNIESLKLHQKLGFTNLRETKKHIYNVIEYGISHTSWCELRDDIKKKYCKG